MLQVKNLFPNPQISLGNIFSGLFLVWGAMAAYTFTPYYANFISWPAKVILLFLASGYSVFLLIKELSAPETLNRPHRVVFALRREITQTYTSSRAHIWPITRFSSTEKTDILFLGIKFFFLPMMVHFAVSNAVLFYVRLDHISWHSFTTSAGFLTYGLLFLLSIIFFLDTFIFALGYAFESSHLHNTIRSVQPSLVGWAVTLICYPPFNTLPSLLIPKSPNQLIELQHNITLPHTILAVLILLAFTYYIFATISLGWRSSNLTNRGIVTTGAYAFVRHPHYISKNIAWLLSCFVVMSPLLFISWLFWASIYYLRAMTEEYHLSQDPEYAAYMQKVPYRFIPYIY